MSNALAIATVTAVLKDLINNGLIDGDLANVGDVAVSALAPDLVNIDNATNPSQLNLFLYHVTSNQGWRNVGLPSRDSSGERLSNPPLALDLHYLLTAYGKQDFHSEILLGYAMQLLHETPILTREAIRQTFQNKIQVNGVANLPILQTLSTSGLDEQIEQIKITPQYLTTEEISKLWSSFQTHYRPTVAYQVSVVLIESRKSTKSALPVRQYQTVVLPFGQLKITDVSPNIVTIGSTLTIQGQNLKADIVKVRFGDIEVTANSVSDRQIQITVPNNLQAGVNTVQIIHRLNFGTPTEPHSGFESNIAAFILRPTITQITPTLQTDANNLSSGTITVNLTPIVRQSQRVILQLNQLNLAPNAPPAKAYSFSANPRTLDTDPVEFTVNGVQHGNYLVRVKVDGAETLPDFETNPNSPNFNLYTGTPQITIP
ncbi:DUF4255 domain-containing protein [Nostoc sp. FACHB-973]|nr:DUF4255 domain-containing protein [Nostoc sp. FACHB-973]